MSELIETNEWLQNKGEVEWFWVTTESWGKKKGPLYIPEGSREGILEEAALEQRMQKK